MPQYCFLFVYDVTDDILGAIEGLLEAAEVNFEAVEAVRKRVFYSNKTWHVGYLTKAWDKRRHLEASMGTLRPMRRPWRSKMSWRPTF